MRPHRDVLWYPQLCLVLAGAKRLTVGPWQGTKARIWDVSVDCSAGEQLGLDLHPSYLVVLAVLPGGLVASRNAAGPPEAAVRPGDVLLAVNGLRGAEAMAEEFGRRGELRLTLAREAALPGASASSVLALAGDLLAFNASARHKATNIGDKPTAALYQGFLSAAAVPRFCAAPAIMPRGEDDGLLCPCDLLWGSEEGEPGLSECTEQLLSVYGPHVRETEAEALEAARLALAAADERLESGCADLAEPFATSLRGRASR